MQKFVKVYVEFFNYCEQDFIPCEIEGCCNEAEKPHHIIYRSHGGKDIIENLMGLCRNCHNKAHDKIFTADYLSDIHIKFMQDYVKNNPTYAN